MGFNSSAFAAEHADHSAVFAAHAVAEHESTAALAANHAAAAHAEYAAFIAFAAAFFDLSLPDNHLSAQAFQVSFWQTSFAQRIAKAIR
jgi:hypothetical protein